MQLITLVTNILHIFHKYEYSRALFLKEKFHEKSWKVDKLLRIFMFFFLRIFSKKTLPYKVIK